MNITQRSFVILALLFSTHVCSQTWIQHNQNTLYFEQAPKLASVLAKINDKNLVYWPSASLFSKSNYALVEQREELLEYLKSLDEQLHPNMGIRSIRQLAQRVTKWQIAKRLSIQIDYDQARIVSSSNPTVSFGEYILSAGPREQSVYVFGAVAHDAPHIIEHKNHTRAANYVDKTWLSPLADPD